MSKQKIVFFIILFSLGFLVRLYRFNGPIADWHSWRQADTSSVSRNFVNDGFDLLHPRFDDISNVPTGIYDNPNGYRFVEFPIYNVLQANLYKLFNFLTLEEWGRMISIFASLISAWAIYRILEKRFGFFVGIASAFFFLFIPYNIYYSRTILPDPLMVTTTLLSILFFQDWINSKKQNILSKDFILALIFIILGLLLKPYAIFFTLPIIYLAYEKYKKDIFKNKTLWLFGIVSVIPLILWRSWMLQFPEGIPQSNWLFNGNGIRFRPSFFYWIFYQRLAKLILGYFTLPIFILGFIGKLNKNLLFGLSFIASSLLYVVVIATGNVQHDYYQILIIPSISIILGIGAANFINLSFINKYLSASILFVLVIFSFVITGNYIKDFFNINDISIVKAGEAVDRLTPKDAKVIANYNGDSSFLYQTKRKGWTSFERSVPELIKKGASYLILVNPTSKDLEIGKTYKIVQANSQYVIFDLLKKP